MMTRTGIARMITGWMIAMIVDVWRTRFIEAVSHHARVPRI
jgi:hypothetical protein